MMTQTQMRDAIATAISIDSTVAGAPVHVTGAPTQPDVIGAYDGWPVWRVTRPVNPCGLVETDWDVLVALPAPMADVWVGAGDALLPDLTAALWPLGQVTRVGPVQIAVAESDSAIPALQFQITM